MAIEIVDWPIKHMVIFGDWGWYPNGMHILDLLVSEDLKTHYMEFVLAELGGICCIKLGIWQHGRLTCSNFGPQDMDRDPGNFTGFFWREFSGHQRLTYLGFDETSFPKW